VPNPLTTIDPLGLLCQTALNMIQSRVDQLHGLLGRGAGYKSTAVIRATDGAGNVFHVVGWSGEDALDSRIAGALRGNEIPAHQMAGDAEVSALATIKANGWTPLGGAANRPVCPWCQNALKEPFDAARGIGPAKLVGPLRTQRIKMFPGKGGTIGSHPVGGNLTGPTQFTW
jgi:hypothetical protein